MCVERYLKRNGLRILISLHDERNQQRTMRLIFIDTQHKAEQQQRVREGARAMSGAENDNRKPLKEVSIHCQQQQHTQTHRAAQMGRIVKAFLQWHQAAACGEELLASAGFLLHCSSFSVRVCVALQRQYCNFYSSFMPQATREDTISNSRQCLC